MEIKTNMATLLTLGRKIALCGFFLASLPVYAGNSPSGPDGVASPVVLLASQLAHKVDNPSTEFKANVASLYAQAYGNLDSVPKSWQIVVRRALTCQILGDQPCLRNSAALMSSLGGADTFKLEKLYEVSQFKANPDDLMRRLQDISNSVDTETQQTEALGEPPAPSPAPAETRLAAIPPEASKTPPPITTKAPESSVEKLAVPTFVVVIIVIGILVGLRRKNEFSTSPANTFSPIVEVDPREASSRSLLETIHSTECDLDWIIEHASQTPGYLKLSESITSIESWRNSLRDARSAMLEEFEKRNWDTTLSKVESPESVENAFTRLVNSAAFFCSLLHLQNKSNSMMYYWSKQIPHSLLKVFWSIQTSSAVAKLNQSPLIEISAGKPPTFAVDLIQESESLFKNAIYHAAKS